MYKLLHAFSILNKHLNIIILLLLLPLGMFLYVAPVNALTPCPTGLTANTTLTTDCTGTISLAKNGITLNCAGYTVSGPGTYGVEVEELLHVTVEKCTITDFAYGLYVAGTNSSTFTANTATGNEFGVCVILYGLNTGASIDDTFSGNTALKHPGGLLLR